MYASSPHAAPVPGVGPGSPHTAAPPPRSDMSDRRVQTELQGRPALVRVVRWTRIVTGALILLYLASTVFRPRGSTSPFYDGWIGNLAYAGCALLCGLRAVAVRDRQRAGWI